MYKSFILNILFNSKIFATSSLDPQFNSNDVSNCSSNLNSVHEIIIEKHAQIFFNEIYTDYKIIQRTPISDLNTFYKLQDYVDNSIHEIYVDETNMYKITEAINNLKGRKNCLRLEISLWVSDMIKKEKIIKMQLETNEFKVEFKSILELFYIDLENTLNVINFLYKNDFIQYNIKMLQTKTCENLYFKLENICKNLLSFETRLMYGKFNYEHDYKNIEKICQTHFNKHFIDHEKKLYEIDRIYRSENNWNRAICYGLYRHKFKYTTYPLFYYFFKHFQDKKNILYENLGVFCIGNLWNKNSYNNNFKHFKLCNMIAFLYADKQKIYKETFDSKERFKRIMYAICGLKSQIIFKSKNHKKLKRHRKNYFGDWLHHILDKIYENLKNKKKYSSMQLYIFCISSLRHKSENFYSKLEQMDQLHLLHNLFLLIVKVKKKLLSVE